MKLSIGCDHGGFELKEAVKAYLEKISVEYEDFGAYSTDSIDYAPIAVNVARSVTKGTSDYGILICTTGVGISIAANKVDGIRAALCTSLTAAEMTRRHNNANILCMGGKFTDTKLALQMVETFLNTDFEGGRHQRRIDQITQIEKGEL